MRLKCAARTGLPTDDWGGEEKGCDHVSDSIREVHNSPGRTLAHTQDHDLWEHTSLPGSVLAASTATESGADRGGAEGSADVRAARRREKKAESVETAPATTAAVTAATATTLAAATNAPAVACLRTWASARGS